MINPVKELRQTDIYREAAAFLDDVSNLFYRLLSISIWPEPKTIV